MRRALLARHLLLISLLGQVSLVGLVKPALAAGGARGVASSAAEPAALFPLVPPVLIASEGDTAAKEVRTIELNDKSAARIFVVRTSVGYPAVVEFPVGFASAPACGACGEKGLFTLDVFQTQHYFTVKPRLRPGPQPGGGTIPESDFVTTITVRLETSLTLTIQVEASERSKADPRVVFTLPGLEKDSAYVREQVAKAKKELLAEEAPKIEAETARAFLKALNEPHRCVAVDAKGRHDDVVVWPRELCRFGSTLYVRFEVENRSRASVFTLGSVEVTSGTEKEKGAEGAGASPGEIRQYIPTPDVAFGKVISAVVAFDAPADDGSSRYTLKLIEEGGRQRVIPSAELHF